MGEKREGFGALGLPEQPSDSIVPIFQTPHYQVVVVRLSNGPEDQPQELRIRYVVLSKRHPVIAGHSGLEGEAMGLALTAEDMLVRATLLAKEQAARNYAPRDDESHHSHGPFGDVPNLG